MTQTILTASGVGNAASLAAGNDGTFILQTGPDGAKVNALSFDATGVPTFLKVPLNSAVQSMVRLNTANGYGSTNTMIRRFTNTVTNQGSDITYADSATLGATFTINTTGVYAVSYSDCFNAVATAGVSLNSSQLTTAVTGITVSDLLIASYLSTANASVAVGWVGYLAAGAVIRAHTIGQATGSSTTLVQFTIVRVA